MVLDQTEVITWKCGLVSDTHGVADQVCKQALVTVSLRSLTRME